MDIINNTELVIKEGGKPVQKGMNFAIQKGYSIVLMSTKKNAPYNDEIMEGGIIEYEGQDVSSNINHDKKLVDQSLATPSGTPTEYGKFFIAASDFKNGKRDPVKVQVYRKIRKGVWVDMGF